MSPTEPISPSMAGILYTDFFGIRGTKSSEPGHLDQQIISIVQENEKHYNHSVSNI